MKCLAVVVALLAGSIAAQTIESESGLKKLTRSLAAITKANQAEPEVRDRLSSDILDLAEERHRPSPETADSLAFALTDGLRWKRPQDSQLSQLATAMLSILHSAGAGTTTFRESLSRAEKILLGMGVSATATRRICADLEALGKEVRGPEGIPAKPLR